MYINDILQLFTAHLPYILDVLFTIYVHISHCCIHERKSMINTFYIPF